MAQFEELKVNSQSDQQELKEAKHRIEALLSQREQQRKSGEEVTAAREALETLLGDATDTLADMDAGQDGKTVEVVAKVRKALEGKRAAALPAQEATTLLGELVEHCANLVKERADARAEAAREAEEARYALLLNKQ